MWVRCLNSWGHFPTSAEKIKTKSMEHPRCPRHWLCQVGVGFTRSTVIALLTLPTRQWVYRICAKWVSTCAPNSIDSDFNRKANQGGTWIGSLYSREGDKVVCVEQSKLYMVRIINFIGISTGNYKCLFVVVAYHKLDPLVGGHSISQTARTNGIIGRVLLHWLV